MVIAFVPFAVGETRNDIGFGCGGVTSGSHSSGTPLPLVSRLAPLLMSQASPRLWPLQSCNSSGIRSPSQSRLVRLVISVGSATPFSLQSSAYPGNRRIYTDAEVLPKFHDCTLLVNWYERNGRT